MGDQENFQKLKHFFEADALLKKEMYDIAPPGIFQYFDEEKYCENVDASLKYMFTELKRIVKDFFGVNSVFYLKTQQLEVDVRHEFYKCGYDKKKLRDFYNNFVSYLHPEFVDLVKKSCVGYIVDFRKMDPMDKFSTVNELLHYLHSYVMNSDGVLQSIPLIAEKKNDFNYPIVYRGIRTDTFDAIYDNFPSDLDVGYTDIVALSDNKLIMMVRDRGHALTIEATKNGQDVRIDYFIPKLCNVEMINALPGVNKIKPDAPGATGAFLTPVQYLPISMYGFISNVPMDKDMPSVRRELARR